MSKSLLFPSAADLTADEHAKLAEAYELACDELVDEYGYSPEKLASVLEPMTVALLALFRAGQHEETALGRYAASKALATERIAKAG
jgi:hypothetical protein